MTKQSFDKLVDNYIVASERVFKDKLYLKYLRACQFAEDKILADRLRFSKSVDKDEKISIRKRKKEILRAINHFIYIKNLIRKNILFDTCPEIEILKIEEKIYQIVTDLSAELVSYEKFPNNQEYNDEIYL